MKEVAVIVAHPDDEIIWCGGLMLQNPHWDWTVLCLCRADDSDRRLKFRAVCQTLDVAGYISDLDDGNPLKPIRASREIGRRVREHLTGMDWDLCLTHGANGEYGHLRHREAHAEVLHLAASGTLRCSEVWTFAYACNPRSGRCRALTDADILLPLTDAQLAEKKRIVHEQYGYGRESFEVQACISPESFHRHRFAAQEQNA